MCLCLIFPLTKCIGFLTPVVQPFRNFRFQFMLPTQLLLLNKLLFLRGKFVFPAGIKFILIRLTFGKIVLPAEIGVFPLRQQFPFLFLNELPNLLLRMFPPVLQFVRNRLRFQTASTAFRLCLNKCLFFCPETELRSEITLLVKLLPRGNEFIPLFFRNIPMFTKFLPFFLRQMLDQHVTGFLRLGLRSLTPVLHPER